MFCFLSGNETVFDCSRLIPYRKEIVDSSKEAILYMLKEAYAETKFYTTSSPTQGAMLKYDC